MTGKHVCLFCGTEIHSERKAGRIPEYCSTHCRNARKYLNAYLRELRHVDLERCGSEVRSELFMIANTIVKAANCRGKERSRGRRQPVDDSGVPVIEVDAVDVRDDCRSDVTGKLFADVDVGAAS